jgi:Uma2 family endonuclease
MDVRPVATKRLEVSQRGTCSLEDFLVRSDEDAWAEWIDGEVIPMSPASDRHQDLVRFLLALLSLHIEARELGWVRSAPFAMLLPDRPQVREPDLLFVRSDRMGLVESTFLNGPADLVVEIVSPESLSRDRGEKFVEYEAAGIPEYWLIDPLREQLDLYSLGEDGRYRLVPAAGDEVASRVIDGFRLKVSWLWRKPLPKILDAAVELGLLRG